MDYYSSPTFSVWVTNLPIRLINQKNEMWSLGPAVQRWSRDFVVRDRRGHESKIGLGISDYNPAGGGSHRASMVTTKALAPPRRG